MIPVITPNWPTPKCVKAYTTTRIGGFSQPPYESLNLAVHVEDDLSTVLANRNHLKEALNLPGEPVWLTQPHENRVIDAHSPATLDTDGAYTNEPNTICAVLTADCLPILLCNDEGTEVAALHCGWRGLSRRFIETGLKKFSSPAQNILVWLGPAIGPQFYEVGPEVYDTCMNSFPELDHVQNLFFQPSPNGRWLLNLYQFARQQLEQSGVKQIYGGDFCTYSDPTRFYSYRRDKQTGRMANLIWIV